MTDINRNVMDPGPYDAAFDDNGNVKDVVYSEKYRRILGYTSEAEYANANCSWEMGIHPADRERVAKVFAACLQPDGGDFDIEYRMMTKWGYRWFHDYAQVKRNAKGIPYRLFGVVFDVDNSVRYHEELKAKQASMEKMTSELAGQLAEIKKLKESAEEASRAKTRFIFNMSHDIRTPLNAITGYVELLERLIPENMHPHIQYLKNIDTAGRQLLDILNDVLEMSSIERHEIVLRVEPHRVRELQSEMQMLFAGEAAKKQIVMDTECHVEHDRLYVDKTQLQKVHMHILANAVQFTPEGGHIRMILNELPGENPDECFIESIIEDNGIGMSQEFQEQLFGVFSREHTSTESGVAGTGLGLAIAKQIVELMQGTIHCESESGVGTKIIMHIPCRIVQAAVTEEIVTSYDDTVFVDRRVLLAEDNQVNAEITEELLKAKGMKVDRAEDGKRCIEMLTSAEIPYDLILMDIQMPVMNGYEATRKIHRLPNPELAKIPIIALTANAFKEDVIHAFEAGMNDHIAKPIDVGKMFAAIADVLK